MVAIVVGVGETGPHGGGLVGGPQIPESGKLILHGHILGHGQVSGDGDPHGRRRPCEIGPVGPFHIHPDGVVHLGPFIIVKWSRP